MKFFILFFVFLCACVEDNGLMVRDDLTIHQDSFPVTVSSVPEHFISTASAIAWWNERIGTDVFVYGEISEVTVYENYIPCIDEDSCPQGLADVVYNYLGEIIACDVTVLTEIAYHEPTVFLILKHEFGHCLGLDDDPRSIDLNSIMSNNPYDDAEVTDQDRDLIRDML